MRKKQHIRQLENQVAELMTTVNALLEVVTKPVKQTAKTPTNTVKTAPTKMTKARLRWSQEEKNTAVKLHANGLSAKDIAALLGRSPIAIANMLSDIRTGK